jgi:hypothetical protein
VTKETIRYRRCGRRFPCAPGITTAGRSGLCPTCRRNGNYQQQDTPTRCSQCGREVRAGGRDLCLGCALDYAALCASTP